MITDKIGDIRLLERNRVEKWLIEQGEQRYRFRQLEEWLWTKGVRSFDEITSFPKCLRDKLSQNFSFISVSTYKIKESKDGTLKSLFSLYDDELVEGVLIISNNRSTACISTQVGCKSGCKFCATGQAGFKRNLHFVEIFDQVTILNKLSVEHTGRPLSNIVFMGMGEPLLNYEAVKESVKYITGKPGLEMSPSRITLSTVGIPEMIKKMGDDNVKYNLAISFHAANDSKRSELIPLAKKYNLKELATAIKYFHKKTNNRITIEYLLLGGVNDLPGDAAELAIFCRNFPVKINLINFNPVKGLDFVNSSKEDTLRFQKILKNKNMIVNIRRSRGIDIDAACGQLAGKSNITE